MVNSLYIFFIINIEIHFLLYFRIKYPRVILRKGHVGQAFYFIFSGSVFINIEGLHVETNEVVYKTVSILQRGDAFGVS